MPNWCDNQVTITGPNSVIDKIEKIVKEEENIDLSSKEKGETPGLLQFFHPMPEELMETEKSSDDKKMKKQPVVGGFNNWYDWRVQNWATKWDVDIYEGSIQEQEELFGPDDGDKRVTFGFDSAWAPPLGAYEHYISNNSDMSIRAVYYEPGCDFMGVWEDMDDRCYQCSEDGPKSDSPFWDTEDGKLIDDYMGCVDRLIEYEEEQELEEANG